MKVKVVTERDQDTFEKTVNLEVLALNGDGNKVKDIKYHFEMQTGMGIIHSAMVIYESK